MALYIVHQAGVEHLRQIGSVQSIIVYGVNAAAALETAKQLSGGHLTVTNEWRVDDLAEVVGAGHMMIEGHPCGLSGFKTFRGA